MITKSDGLLSVLLFIFFFFFSSRRRHTRYIGDWSSDVCSSDLPQVPGRTLPPTLWCGAGTVSAPRRTAGGHTDDVSHRRLCIPGGSPPPAPLPRAQHREPGRAELPVPDPEARAARGAVARGNGAHPPGRVGDPRRAAPALAGRAPSRARGAAGRPAPPQPARGLTGHAGRSRAPRPLPGR